MTDLYDQVAYVNRPIRHTHPGHLAALGLLHGLEPPPVETARVLDVGASEGGNVLAQAQALPNATFTGIDLASAPVERGSRVVRDLGLTNVRLLRMDLLDVTEELGTFDYVLAHGLYAWTPPHVRDALLALARRNLASSGLAYVSYNTLPGGHVRRILRDAMLAAAPPGGRDDPAALLARGREVLRLLAAGRPKPSPTDAAVAAEAQKALGLGDAALFHDLLAPVFEPASLRDFVAHAARHGLAYVDDASTVDTWNLLLLPEVVAEATRLVPDDPIGLEQLTDALRVRAFRQSIVARAEADPRPAWDASRIAGCWVSCAATGGEGGTFLLRGGGSLTVEHPAVAGLLRRLVSLWPGAERVEAGEAELVAELFRRGVVELSTAPSPAGRAGERPVASRLARYQAARGDAEVASLDCRSVMISIPEVRTFLALLDGSRTRDELAAEGGCSREDVDRRLSEIERLALLLPG